MLIVVHGTYVIKLRDADSFFKAQRLWTRSAFSKFPFITGSPCLVGLDGRTGRNLGSGEVTGCSGLRCGSNADSDCARLALE